jgi:peptidoglycan/xylan/chitin deacetylase (PgdA/CDA1 family)
MNVIKKDGFTVLPLDELVQRAMKPKSTTSTVDEKIVAITFDDAYRSIYTTAFPNLRARGWPFTIFAATRLIKEKSGLYLSWPELMEMSKSGATIANHTHSHTHMVRRMSTETDLSWRHRIEEEILTAKRLLSEHGLRSNLFAYPYGEYDEKTLKLVANLKMIGFGQQSGAIGPNSNPLILPRYPLAGIYVSKDAFRNKLHSLPMPIKHPALPPLVSDDFMPSLQLSFTENPANLSRLSCFGPGGKMALTRIAPLTFSATPQKEIPVGRSRYNCTLPKGPRFYWFSQLWIRKENDGSWYYEP